MKPVLLLIALMVNGAAHAAPDLEKQAEREGSWSTVSAPLPGVSGNASFAVTEDGSLRLIELGSGYAGELKIKGKDGVFKNLRSEAQLTRACGNLRGSLEFELENRNKFEIQVLANPLNSEAVSQGIADNSGWRTRHLKLETAVHTIKVEPVLSYVNNATPLTTNQRLRELQGEIARVVRAQESQIAEKGMLHAEIAGIDDLACDLIQGHVKLEFRLTATFDAAYVRRAEVISGRAIQDLQQRLKAMPVGEGAAMSKMLARAANLGVLLQNQLGAGYGGFMNSKFHKFHAAVINPADASVVDLSIDAAVKAARKLDDLSVGRDTNSTTISSKAGWIF